MAEEEKKGAAAPAKEAPKEAKTDEKSAEDGAPKAAKTLNPWIPIAAVIVAMPILAFLTTMFVLIPSMRSAMTKEEAPAHAPKKSSGGHGSSHGGGEQGGSKQTMVFNDITANLAGSLQSRYIKVGFTVEGSDASFANTVDENRVRLIDATLTVLSALTLNQLEEPGVKNSIRNDLLNLFESVLGKRVIEQIYFSEFVVQ